MHVVAFDDVVADVEKAAFEVVSAEAAANAAACCVDEIEDAVADVAPDVEAPESVASTGLSQELLCLQGCE